MLIGQQLADLSRDRAALPNVHLLGQKPHDELPAYCKGFDVGMIPYRIDERMTFVNPLKLREYLSAGLPVVSTPVPEVARLSRTSRASRRRATSSSRRSSARSTRRAPAARGARSLAMRNETWSARVAKVDAHGRRDASEEETTMSNAAFAPAWSAPATSASFMSPRSRHCPTSSSSASPISTASARTTNAEKWGTTAFDSLDALVDAGANVIHVLTPPASHAKVALAALERGCHVLIEKPIAEDEAEAREIGAARADEGPRRDACNHSLLYDPQVKRALDAVQAGALGQVVSVDILRGSEYPPYEGGPLPPWYRDAGYPFRDIGVHCLYLIQELLGPIEDVEARLALARRRSEPRVRRVARDRALQARPRPVPADLEHASRCSRS